MRMERGAIPYGVLLLLAAVLGASVLAGWAVLRGQRHNPPPWRRLATALDEERVDAGRIQILRDKIYAVSFRTRQEGWVTDSMGHAFHTVDGGVTFMRVPASGRTLALVSDVDPEAADHEIAGQVGSGPIVGIEWLSPERAVAFGLNDPARLVTTDAGASWKRVPIPDNFIVDSAHAGRSIWTCAVFGRPITRSRDGGDSFERTRTSPYEAPHGCFRISFADDRHGWVADGSGGVFETSDGGDTWQPLHLPEKSAVGHGRAIARLSADEGWVTFGDPEQAWRSRAYFTGDGGKTWAVKDPPVAVVAQLMRGSAWGDGVVFPVEGQRLRFVAGGDLVRETPIVGQRDQAIGLVRGREPLASGHIAAFTGAALIETFDDGRSWSTFARVRDGTPIQRSLIADGLRLVQLTDGRVLRLEVPTFGEETLVPSAQPAFDRYRLDAVERRRRGAPPAVGPLGQLAAAPEGSLIATFEKVPAIRFDPVRLVWTERKSTVGGDGPTVEVTADERRRLLRAIAAAVERPDDGHHLPGQADLEVDLTWQSGAGPVDSAEFREGGRGPAHRVRDLLAPYIAARR